MPVRKTPTRPRTRAASTRRPAATAGRATVSPRLPARPGLAPGLVLAPERLQRIQQLRLNNPALARDEVVRLGLKREELAPSVDTLFQASHAKALNFTRGVAASWRDEQQGEQEAEPLIDWARRAGPQQRQLVARAMHLQQRGVLVVHHIGGMARADAQAFMKDFFEGGGTVDEVADWMQRAGHVLRTERPQGPGTDGLFSKAWNWVKGAVKTVGDALKAAGKSLADAMGKVLSWTADKVADFVEGLVQAGRRVGEILDEAVKKGAAAVRKFARALIDAGRAVREVVQEAARLASQYLQSLFQGLMDAGRKVLEVAREVARYTGQVLKRLVTGLYQAFRDLTGILVAFMRDQVSTLRMVLEGLFAAGVTFAQSIAAICTGVVEQFRKGFFQGLIALGKTPFLIMQEALKLAGGVAALAFATLLDVLGGHRALTALEKQEARRVYGVSIDLERVKVAVASIPADLINLVNGQRPFTTMYVINFSSRATVDLKTLIHELAHVYQGVVAGPVYMIEALHAQVLGEGYAVTNDMLRTRGNKLSAFNREQQAVIAEEYWYEAFGRTRFPGLSNRGLDVNLLRPYAQQMFKAPPGTVRPLPLPIRPLPIPVRVPPIRVRPAAAARNVRVRNHRR